MLTNYREYEMKSSPNAENLLTGDIEKFLDGDGRARLVQPNISMFLSLSLGRDGPDASSHTPIRRTQPTLPLRKYFFGRTLNWAAQRAVRGQSWHFLLF